MRKIIFCATIFILIIPLLVFSQERKWPMAINSQAPEFSLSDLSGNMVTLSDFIEKNNVMLVVYRGWLEDHF